LGIENTERKSGEGKTAGKKNREKRDKGRVVAERMSGWASDGGGKGGTSKEKIIPGGGGPRGAEGGNLFLNGVASGGKNLNGG